MSATPAQPGILASVIDSIFTPGTNTGLVQAMSYSFYALFVTLIGMLFLTGGNIHIWALLGLSVGLFASIKWFLEQIKDVEELHRIEREKKEQEDKSKQAEAEEAKKDK
ncbi:Pkr1p [Pseudohyphozyma bogoriensis]|nr:Pkr1p [Pseudohyphozyma bogoriensis]